MYVCNVYMYACMVSIYKAIRSEIRLRFAMWQVSAGARTAGSLVDCRQRHFQHRWAQTTSSQAGDELMQRSRMCVDGAPRDKKRWSMVVVECRRWALAVLTLYSSDGTWGGKCKTQNITHTHTHACTVEYVADYTYEHLFISAVIAVSGRAQREKWLRPTPDMSHVSSRLNAFRLQRVLMFELRFAVGAPQCR